jgi:S1-C subfamily serine protease
VSYDDFGTTTAAPRTTIVWIALGVAVLSLGIAVLSFARQQTAIDAAKVAQLHATRVERQLKGVYSDSRRLSKRISSTERDVSLAPLARRAQKSVFTITAGPKLGTAFAAWRVPGGTYLITANHVVDGHTGPVTIEKPGGSWEGEIVRRDRKNDLALVHVAGSPQGAPPLWQRPRTAKPRVGDRLVLAGSPYGLGGTITTGIVSRVTRRMIQTDAAANPGNSGGPAIDRKGRVVGVLLAGGGENINFAVRIDRACQTLRSC